MPATCAAVGASCGSILDGCGGTVACGACGANESCGGGGTANVCGPGTCLPTTCVARGKNCGQMSDGCAAIIECGTCSAGQTCGAGGANVCGTGSCKPTTCAAQGKDCGTISDGCSGVIACGACAAPELCGVGAKPNVCAAPCPDGCPTGYSCDSAGVCTGGTSTAIVLDVKTVTVSGTVTLNGAAPVPISGCSSSYGTATVTLTETMHGYTFQQTVPCTSNAWSLTVFPGSYRAVVQGVESNVPGTSYVAKASLAVTTPQSNIVLDVKTVTASGTVTLNGAAPVPISGCSSSYGIATVTLTETTNGYSFQQTVPCTSNAWNLTVYPGTYRAEVQGVESNLPGTGYVASSAIALTAAQSNIVLDVKTVTVSGTVTLNGAAPVPISGCSSSYGIATVTLTETTNGYSFQQTVPCTSNAWNVTVYPGTYRAEVQGVESNVPGTSYVANAALALTAAQSNIALDVKTVAASGTVTLNGAAPVPISGCSSSYGIATVTLTETTYGYSFQQTVPCTSNAWNLTVYPGAYRAYVQGVESNLPGSSYVASGALTLTSAQANIALDVKTVTASGTVTLNGAAPVPISGCSSSYGIATVTLTETTYGYSFQQTVPCTSNAWSLTVFPGTYRAEVQGVESNVPGTSYVANAGLVVSAPQSNVVLDVKTVTVGGTVTLNGAAPVPISGCSSSYGIATVTLTETTNGYAFQETVPCTSNAWSLTIYPGTYRAEVQGVESDVPGTADIVVDRIDLF